MKKYMTVILLLFVLLLSGCLKKDTTSQNTDQTEGKEEDLEEKNVPEAEDGVFPLTGEKTNEPVDHRLVGVMVNNHPAARPQSGLSQADIVFEILAEGSTTRFLALYHSERPDVVGPVRSARSYYFDLTQGLDGLYIYHGAADIVQAVIDQQNVAYLNGSIYDNDGYLFKRESFREAPHNSYLQFDAVYDVAESKGYEIDLEPAGRPFKEDDATIEGDVGNRITVMYQGKDAQTGVDYIYNETDETYERFENQEQTVELDSETPIQMDNVFVIEAPHEVIDEEGRRSIDMTAGGNAYLLQKGHVQQLEWKNDHGHIVPVKDGQVVGFIPGQTWINVVPTDPGLEQSVNIQNE